MPSQNRRLDHSMDDKIQEQIDQLIMDAKDPMMKGLLIVIGKLANAVDANTKVSGAMIEDVKKHSTLLENARGVWIAASFLLMIIQGMLVWWFNGHIEEISKTQSEVTRISAEIEKHKEHHIMEERGKNPRVEK